MAGLLPAGATTPPCGSANCSNIYSLKFHDDFPLDVYHAQSSYGQPVILFQRSNSDPAQDFVVKDLGTVDSFYTSSRGLISPAFDQAYGPEEAFEIQYEPYGDNSNFCVGTTPDQIAQSGEKVALYPCGTSASTIWAQDTNPNDGTTAPGYSVCINGETNSFSNPLVLNYPAGNPTDMAPRAAERPAAERLLKRQAVLGLGLRQPAVERHRRHPAAAAPAAADDHAADPPAHLIAPRKAPGQLPGRGPLPWRRSAVRGPAAVTSAGCRARCRRPRSRPRPRTT